MTPAANGGVQYGNHMAVGMAIGFLFMGAGARTFSTSKSAVAALVISLFPRYPQSPSDQRCHLQVGTPPADGGLFWVPHLHVPPLGSPGSPKHRYHQMLCITSELHHCHLLIIPLSFTFHYPVTSIC